MLSVDGIENTEKGGPKKKAFNPLSTRPHQNVV